MKNILYKVFQVSMLAVVVLALKACVNPVDLTTKDAKTGGLVVPVTSNVPYKLNATPSVAISLKIPMGPGIKSLEVHNMYTTVDGKTSNEVILTTLDINSGNSSKDVDQSFTVTYADLSKDLVIDGNPMPANEGALSIGDSWTLSYTSIMSDGRKVLNNGKTGIGVANAYAGNYQCVGIFHHPTAGDRPINQEKYLSPVDAYSCITALGDLGASGYDITITVNPEDNSVVVTKGVTSPVDVFNSVGLENSYNPATGVFVLHYYYIGGNGLARVIEETYTPIP
jgi:hypothetical protein